MKKRIEPTIGNIADPEDSYPAKRPIRGSQPGETIQIPPLQRKPVNPRTVQQQQSRPTASPQTRPTVRPQQNPKTVTTTKSTGYASLREQQIALQRQQQTPQPRIRGMSKAATPKPVQTRPQVVQQQKPVFQSPTQQQPVQQRPVQRRPVQQQQRPVRQQQPVQQRPVQQARVTPQPSNQMHAEARPMVRPQNHRVSSDPRSYPVAPGLFSLTGRIGCIKAIALNFVALLFATLVFAISLKIAGSNKNLFFMLSAIGASVAGLGLLIVFSKRLRDIDLSPWWILVLAIPGINALFYAFVLFWPGTDDMNRFGYPAEENTFIAFAISFSLFLTTPIALGYTSIEVYEKVIFSGKNQIRYEQKLEE